MIPKCRKAWTVLKLNLTIQTDEKGYVWDINVNDGYRSCSYDNCMPTLEEIIEEFDYD